MTKTTETFMLPSMHIDHSAVFSNELMARISGLDGAILALEVDMEGMERAYQDARAKLDSEHESAMQERRALKTDIERTRRMALAAQEAYSAGSSQSLDTNDGLDADRPAGNLDNSALTPERAVSDHTD